MIVYLFKNCTWGQQIFILIESLNWNMFYQKYFEKTNMWMGLHHKFQAAVIFASLISFTQIHVYKFAIAMKSSCYEGFDKDHFV